LGRRRRTKKGFQLTGDKNKFGDEGKGRAEKGKERGYPGVETRMSRVAVGEMGS